MDQERQELGQPRPLLARWLLFMILLRTIFQALLHVIKIIFRCPLFLNTIIYSKCCGPFLLSGPSSSPARGSGEKKMSSGFALFVVSFETFLVDLGTRSNWLQPRVEYFAVSILKFHTQ